MMKFKRKNISMLLFIAVFIVYVISPLMFPYGSIGYAGIMPHHGKANSPEAIHISFEKLVLFKLGHQGGKTDKSPSGVIIHKNRTIISENKIIKSSLKHYPLVAEDSLPVISDATPLRIAVSDGTETSSRFDLLSSDPSPPIS